MHTQAVGEQTTPWHDLQADQTGCRQIDRSTNAIDGSSFIAGATQCMAQLTGACATTAACALTGHEGHSLRAPSHPSVVAPAAAKRCMQPAAHLKAAHGMRRARLELPVRPQAWLLQLLRIAASTATPGQVAVPECSAVQAVQRLFCAVLALPQLWLNSGATTSSLRCLNLHGQRCASTIHMRFFIPLTLRGVSSASAQGKANASSRGTLCRRSAMRVLYVNIQ